ncbi:MAG: CBS domain-containing protein [Sandaracinaceae bacterium]|nr:CBS domain-containing protein [Sandaracinaceae bacterium]
MKVRDVMSREVKTLRRNDALDLADQLMKMNRIRHLVVLDDDEDRVAGVVSQRDLFLGALARALGYGSAGAYKVMATLVVKEVMASEPVTIEPDAPLADAARIMLESKIGCLPVVDGDRLVGIVTESDFVRLAAS